MNPLKIMDEIERISKKFGYRPAMTSSYWQALRTAIEAQAEELAQKDARIAHLEGALQEVRKAFPDLEEYEDADGNPLDGLSRNLDSILISNETDRQSLAAVKAEALREAAESMGSFFSAGAICTWLRSRADRIEQEAKE